MSIDGLHCSVIKPVSALWNPSPLRLRKRQKTNIRKKIWVIWLSEKSVSMRFSLEIKSCLTTWAVGPVAHHTHCSGFLHLRFSVGLQKQTAPPLFVWIPTRSNGSESLMLLFILFDSFLPTFWLSSNPVFLLLPSPRSFPLSLSVSNSSSLKGIYTTRGIICFSSNPRWKPFFTQQSQDGYVFKFYEQNIAQNRTNSKD